MNLTCNDSISHGCAFVVGVVGMESRLSSFRIKGFYGNNKLKVGIPVISSPES